MPVTRYTKWKDNPIFNLKNTLTLSLAIERLIITTYYSIIWESSGISSQELTIGITPISVYLRQDLNHLVIQPPFYVDQPLY